MPNHFNGRSIVVRLKKKTKKTVVIPTSLPIVSTVKKPDTKELRSKLAAELFKSL